MTITIGAPTLQSTGSADDGDAAGAACSYGPINGVRQCTDGPSLSSANPGTALVLSPTAQAASGNNATRNATANAKAASQASLTIAYTFFERILSLFGRKQRLAVTIDFVCFADVNDGPNQATFAVFITRGPGGASPIPVYQQAYTFSRNANPVVLNVAKSGAAAGMIPNPGQFKDADPGLTVPIDPGTYTLQFEVNGSSTTDGRVVVSPVGALMLAEG